MAKERRESELEAESSGLKAQVAGYDEKVKAFETAESRLTDAFQNLASHALTRNNQQFLALAKENSSACRARRRATSSSASRRSRAPRADERCRSKRSTPRSGGSKGRANRLTAC